MRQAEPVQSLQLAQSTVLPFEFFWVPPCRLSASRIGIVHKCQLHQDGVLFLEASGNNKNSLSRCAPCKRPLRCGWQQPTGWNSVPKLIRFHDGRSTDLALTAISLYRVAAEVLFNASVDTVLNMTRGFCSSATECFALATFRDSDAQAEATPSINAEGGLALW